MRKTKPEIIVISGANGVGKTTFAKPYVEKIGYEFLNADEIAKKLDEKGYKNVMIKAGREFFSRLQVSIRSRKNIVVETTLSGSYINKVAKRALEQGYQLKVIYIFVDDDNICVDRVRSRVLKGGHDVPEEDIRRRFHRSIQNFWKNFIPISNYWMLLYNGDESYQQVALGLENTYSVENINLFTLFQSILTTDEGS